MKLEVKSLTEAVLINKGEEVRIDRLSMIYSREVDNEYQIDTREDESVLIVKAGTKIEVASATKSWSDLEPWQADNALNIIKVEFVEESFNFEIIEEEDEGGWSVKTAHTQLFLKKIGGMEKISITPENWSQERINFYDIRLLPKADTSQNCILVALEKIAKTISEMVLVFEVLSDGTKRVVVNRRAIILNAQESKYGVRVSYHSEAGGPFNYGRIEYENGKIFSFSR